MVDVKKIALFVGGVVFGSAGFKVLASKDAKKVYTQTTAAVLRMKDSTMETVNKVQEQAGDILADAKAINEARCRGCTGSHRGRCRDGSKDRGIIPQLLSRLRAALFHESALKEVLTDEMYDFT